MDQHRYRCNKSGTLCAFALDNEPVTIDDTEPPCGLADCHPGAEWLEAWPASRFTAPRRAVIIGAAALVLLAGAGVGYFYFRRDVPGADRMITEFYPDLPPGAGAGR